MAEYGDEALEEVDEDNLAQLIIEYDEALEEIDEDDLAQMLADYEDEALEEVECRTRIIALLSLTVAYRALRTTPNCPCCSNPRSSSLLQARKRCPRAPRRLLLPVLRMISKGVRLIFSAT